MLICPKCKGNQAYKILEDKINYVVCPQCGFRCYLKHYRSNFNDMENVLTILRAENASRETLPQDRLYSLEEKKEEVDTLPVLMEYAKKKGYAYVQVVDSLMGEDYKIKL
jgi:Zn ribbon nucleic-acid-binding protein